MASERTYRFPDREWWAERSARCDVPDYRIERRPNDAHEYGTDAESIVRYIVKRVVNKFDPIAVGCLAQWRVETATSTVMWT